MGLVRWASRYESRKCEMDEGRVEEKDEEEVKRKKAGYGLKRE